MSNLDKFLAEVRARVDAAGYTVLRDGRIWSHKSDWRGYGSREMKQDLNSHGYPRVRLTIDNKRKTFMVHTLVAMFHIGPRPTLLHEVCHRDGDKNHNHVRNLYWGTRKDNAADRTKHGNCKAAENGRKSAHKLKGNKNGCAK